MSKKTFLAVLRSRAGTFAGSGAVAGALVFGFRRLDLDKDFMELPVGRWAIAASRSEAAGFANAAVDAHAVNGALRDSPKRCEFLLVENSRAFVQAPVEFKECHPYLDHGKVPVESVE